MSDLEITISNITTTIKIKNKEDVELYISTAKDMNIEYNSACIEIGQNIDKTIMLFYLLLKVEFKKNKSISPNIIMLNLIKKISKYIFEKNTDIQTIDDEIDNIKKIRNFLIYINLSERIKLKKSGFIEEKEENTLDLINNFSGNIKNQIEILKNELLLL